MCNSEFNIAGKNTRYIKTKVDDTPKILHLLTCNLCPLLKFETGQYVANVTRCAKYHSITTNITDNDVYSYSVMGNRSIPLKDIAIPDWCGLSPGICLINASGDMYVRNGHNSYEIVPHIYQSLVVVSTLYVQYDVKLEKLVSGARKNSIYFPPAKNIKALPEGTITKNYKSLATCSCCGQMVENVDRKKNIGMCPKCWDENKDNDKIKHFAYVNNFRLKRNSTWTDEIHKKIKEND